MLIRHLGFLVRKLRLPPVFLLFLSIMPSGWAASLDCDPEMTPDQIEQLKACEAHAGCLRVFAMLDACVSGKSFLVKLKQGSAQGTEVVSDSSLSKALAAMGVPDSDLASCTSRFELAACRQVIQGVRERDAAERARLAALQPAPSPASASAAPASGSERCRKLVGGMIEKIGNNWNPYRRNGPLNVNGRFDYADSLELTVWLQHALIRVADKIPDCGPADKGALRHYLGDLQGQCKRAFATVGRSGSCESGAYHGNDGAGLDAIIEETLQAAR